MFGFDAVRHERRHPWYELLARGMVCALVIGGGWLLSGWAGSLMGAISVPLLFSQSLLGLPSRLVHRLRASALREVSGNFYAFKGLPMRVLDDEVERMRWLRVADLGRALGETLKDSALRQRYAEGLRDTPEGLFISDQAALAYLAERQTDRSARLRVWVEREVWYPARHRHAGRR